MSMNGLFLSGRYAGYNSRSGRNSTTGEAWTLHFIGVEVPKAGGFPGETMVHPVQLSRDHVNSGLLSNLQQFEGKHVSLSVYVRAFPNRGGAAYQFNLSSDKDPIQVLK